MYIGGGRYLKLGVLNFQSMVCSMLLGGLGACHPWKILKNRCLNIGFGGNFNLKTNSVANKCITVASVVSKLNVTKYSILIAFNKCSH